MVPAFGHHLERKNSNVLKKRNAMASNVSEPVLPEQFDPVDALERTDAQFLTPDDDEPGSPSKRKDEEMERPSNESSEDKMVFSDIIRQTEFRIFTLVYATYTLKYAYLFGTVDAQLDALGQDYGHHSQVLGFLKR